MTRKEFNEKWRDHIEPGYVGMAFDFERITAYIDHELDELKTWYPGFRLKHFVMKHGKPHLLLNHGLDFVAGNIETNIKKLMRGTTDFIPVVKRYLDETQSTKGCKVYVPFQPGIDQPIQ